MLRRAIVATSAAELFGAEHAAALLRACWRGAVGPRLAERTQVVSLDAGTLVVRVPDARYGKILHRLRREILERLRQAVGARAPRALGFVIGDVPAAAAAAKAPPESAPRALPTGLTGEALQITDEEIRALFVRSASRYLSRSRG